MQAAGHELAQRVFFEEPHQGIGLVDDVGVDSPGDVEVLVLPSAVLEEDLLWTGTGSTEALRPSRPRCFLEEWERSDRVDRPALEVPRVRNATHATIAQRSASTAAECESRMGAQEQEDVGASVPVEPSEDGEFIGGPSAHEVVR